MRAYILRQLGNIKDRAVSLRARVFVWTISLSISLSIILGAIGRHLYEANLLESVKREFTENMGSYYQHYIKEPKWQGCEVNHPPRSSPMTVGVEYRLNVRCNLDYDAFTEFPSGDPSFNFDSIWEQLGGNELDCLKSDELEKRYSGSGKDGRGRKVDNTERFMVGKAMYDDINYYAHLIRICNGDDKETTRAVIALDYELRLEEIRDLYLEEILFIALLSFLLVFNGATLIALKPILTSPFTKIESDIQSEEISSAGSYILEFRTLAISVIEIIDDKKRVEEAVASIAHDVGRYPKEIAAIEDNRISPDERSRIVGKFTEVLRQLGTAGDEHIHGSVRRLGVSDLGEIVLRIREDLMRVYKENCFFDVYIDPNTSVALPEEPTEKILFELMNNGAKYAKDRGRGEGKHVRVRSSIEPLIGDRGSGNETSDTFRITIEDNGDGIPEISRDNVFRKGWRLRWDRIRGKGIGLYGVREIVREYGGQITFETSDVLGGACAILLLPVDAGDPEAE